MPGKSKTTDDIIEKYLEVNGISNTNHLYDGLSAFGLQVIIDILRKEAIPQKKIVEFYYASDEDLECDKLSYRLVSELRIDEEGREFLMVNDTPVGKISIEKQKQGLIENAVSVQEFVNKIASEQNKRQEAE